MSLSEELVETFRRLFAEAEAAGETDANAMNLATVRDDGRPASRIVLMKQFDAQGVVFYTNLLSDKGVQLHLNPHAALCFHWKRLRDGVQVSFEGRVERVSDSEADAYFHSRPRDSQLGAWASLQSQVLPDRSVFDARFAEAEARFGSGLVTRPPHWSGLRLVPDRVEFWYGVPYRLHERHRHEWRDGVWHASLLFP